MADIRRRNGAKGITYQVRYRSKATRSGYMYKTFATAKEARAFREDSSACNTARPRNSEITTIEQAVQRCCGYRMVDRAAPVVLLNA